MIINRHLKEIFFLSFRLDFKRKKGEKIISFIRKNFLAFLLTSYFLASGAYVGSDVFSYIFILHSFSIVFAGINILSNIDLIFGSEKEILFFTMLPVNMKNFFTGKIMSALIYLLILGSVFNIFPVIFLYLKNPSFLLVFYYLLLNALLVLFIASVILTLYFVFLKSFSKFRFKNILSVLQVAFLLLIILSYQFIASTSGPKIVHFTIRDYSIINIFPSAWFSYINLIPLRFNLFQSLAFIFCVSFITGILIYFLIFQVSKILSNKYERLLPFGKKELLENKKGRKKLLFKILKIIIRDKKERAAFEFMDNLFRSDKSMKMRILPGLIFPLSVIIIGIVNNTFNDPFITGGFSESSISHMILLYFISFIAYFSAGTIKISSLYEASWIFSVFNTSIVKIKLGLYKNLFIKVILPFFFLIMIIFLFEMNILHAFLQILFLYLVFRTVVLILIYSDREIPLARKPERSDSISGIYRMIFIFPLVIVFMVIHYLTYNKILLFINTMFLIYIIEKIIEKRLLLKNS